MKLTPHGNWKRLSRAAAYGSMHHCADRACLALATYVCNAHLYDGDWCGTAYCGDHLPAKPAQQPGSCSPACVHLMEAATLSARLVDLESRVTSIADEAFGPFPVQPTEDSLTAIERGIFELRQTAARLDKCMDALRACAGEQFGKCPICGHRISQCDKNPIWGDETCGGHLARVALKAVRP